MMAELQAKQRRRQLAAMTPEERAAEEAKNNPQVSKDAVNAKLAELNAGGGGGTQEAPKTAVMVGKGAPPPPPPPPPPPALKAPPPPKPPGAAGPPKPAVQQQQQQQQQPKPQPAVQVQVQSPPPPPKVESIVETPVAQPPVQAPVQPPVQPPVQAPVQAPPPVQAPVQAPKQFEEDVMYPAPKKSGQQQADSGVDYVVPQGKQQQHAKKPPTNYFLAITGKNLLAELNKLQFDCRDDVLHLYPPTKNLNPNPHFKSIMEGFRELDKNPEEAVMYLAKKAKATQNFLRFFPNDNNAWCNKQLKENLDKLKFKYSAQLESQN